MRSRGCIKQMYLPSICESTDEGVCPATVPTAGRPGKKETGVRRPSAVTVTSLAVVTALALSACGGGSGSSDEGGTASKTVRVTVANHVWTDNLKKALPEFEKQTG